MAIIEVQKYLLFNSSKGMPSIMKYYFLFFFAMTDLHAASTSTDEIQEFIDLANSLKGKHINSSYCHKYANLAVDQENIRTKKGCNVIGKNKYRWSSQYDIQYNWCLTVSSHATEKETLYREGILKKCEPAISEISDSGITSISENYEKKGSPVIFNKNNIVKRNTLKYWDKVNGIVTQFKFEFSLVKKCTNMPINNIQGCLNKHIDSSRNIANKISKINTDKVLIEVVEHSLKKEMAMVDVADSYTQFSIYYSKKESKNKKDSSAFTMLTNMARALVGDLNSIYEENTTQTNKLENFYDVALNKFLSAKKAFIDNMRLDTLITAQVKNKYSINLDDVFIIKY